MTAAVGAGVGLEAVCASAGSSARSEDSSARPDRSRSRLIPGSAVGVAVGVATAMGDAVAAGSIGIAAALDLAVDIAGAGLITWLSTILTPCHAIVVAAMAAPTQRMTKARARIIR